MLFVFSFSLSVCLLFDYGHKVTTFFRISKFFLIFLYKMFWKRYYKSFSVRMEIITNNAIIIFCHLVEVAKFAVCDFFSLFAIAVFNIPILHIIIVLLFLLQRYNLFPYLQTFFNFFCFWRLDLPTITNFVFMLCLSPPFSGGRVPAVFRVWWRPDDYLPTIIHTRIHTRAHVRARGFLDSNF